MHKHTDSFSLRTAVEKVFAGFAATVIIAFISAGTVAMCFPNIA
jgi:cell division protein FtsN